MVTKCVEQLRQHLVIMSPIVVIDLEELATRTHRCYCCSYYDVIQLQAYLAFMANSPAHSMIGVDYLDL